MRRKKSWKSVLALLLSVSMGLGTVLGLGGSVDIAYAKTGQQLQDSVNCYHTGIENALQEQVDSRQNGSYYISDVQIEEKKGNRYLYGRDRLYLVSCSI